MRVIGAGVEETDVRYGVTGPEETAEEVRAAVRKAWEAGGAGGDMARHQVSVSADQMDWFW